MVQNAHRVASRGISLRHSGHLFVVGSSGGCLRNREISAFTGETTKKYIAVAVSRNEISTFIKSPYKNVLPFTTSFKLERSGTFTMTPISGVNKSFTIAFTTPPNDAPTITPTAKSRTFPLRINCLKPFNIVFTDSYSNAASQI